MYLSLMIGLLSTSMVFGGDLLNAEVKYRVKDDGNMMREDVDLDYEENVIIINTPPMDGKTPGQLMYHIPQGLTMLRQADHCFLLNTGFTDQFSNNMDDWFENADEVNVMEQRDVVFHNYTYARFPLDRKKIPPEIQEGCDEIYPAVLVNTVKGRRAYNLKNSGDITTPFLIQAFGSQSRDQNENRNGRQKRSAKGFETFVAALAPAIPDILNGVVGIAGDLIKAAVQG